MAKILDGRKVRDEIGEKLSEAVKKLSHKPALAILQVGALSESSSYIKQKVQFGEKIGCTVLHFHFPETVNEEELVEKIKELNADTSVHGMIVQLPIPAHLRKENVIGAIDWRKDVDGLHERNVKALWENRVGHVPATARGILSFLLANDISPAGKKVVVIGRSSLVGKPTALLMLNQNATVTVCHSKTADLASETRGADILISAIGRPKFISKDHVSPGQVVIDVGINLISGEKLEDEVPHQVMVGDVDFEGVEGIVAAVSPVPGGVGPVTVASLFENLMDAYRILNP